MNCVTVKTDGDNFAKLKCGDVVLEFEKDGDSPACPNSWTWEVWVDGVPFDCNDNEASLAFAAKDAAVNLGTVADMFEALRDYLVAYGAFGKENR